MGSEDEYCYDYEDEDTGWLEDYSTRLPERRGDVLAITAHSLSAAQQQDLSMVMNLVNVRRHNARALLVHHRWKMDRIHDFLERRGREGLLMEAGIVDGPQEESNRMAAPAGSSTATAPSGTVRCNVCFDDFSPCGASAMDCGHCFCDDCWTNHFVASIETGKKCIRCMEVKCSAICDEAMVRRLLGRMHPDAAERFERFLLESYLENNDSMRWCPSTPHCGRAIRVGSGEARHCEVECPCGASFCLNCASPAHSPCPCAMWDRWVVKLHGESENLNWIASHTKSCPRCHNPIEKNGGCNHVKFRCGQHLCYACGEALTDTHNCNRYVEGKANVDSLRRQILRYAHYCQRFKMHRSSYDVEQGKLWLAVETRMGLLQSAGLKRPLIRDAGWMGLAHRSLVGSRSYAFAYYMFGDELPTYRSEKANLAMAQNLFEDQQERLERNVERLSKVLAADMPAVLPEVEILRTMQETVNLAKIIESGCREMYKCIRDELLPLLMDPMNIAAYRPDGPDKAMQLPE